MAKSTLEQNLELQMRLAKIPPWRTQFKFHPTRRWKSDFAWPDKMLMLECEGGVWCQGRHTRPAGYENDCYKYNEALLMGYRVIRVTSTHIGSGIALIWVERALGIKN